MVLATPCASKKCKISDHFLIIYKRLQTNAWAEFNAICRIYKGDTVLLRSCGIGEIFKAVLELEALELRQTEKHCDSFMSYFISLW